MRGSRTACSARTARARPSLGTLAQWARHPAFNRRDEGSSPSRPTLRARSVAEAHPALNRRGEGSMPSEPTRAGHRGQSIRSVSTPAGEVRLSGSSNGRTLAFDSSNAGSIPAPGSSGAHPRACNFVRAIPMARRSLKTRCQSIRYGRNVRRYPCPHAAGIPNKTGACVRVVWQSAACLFIPV